LVDPDDHAGTDFVRQDLGGGLVGHKSSGKCGRTIAEAGLPVKYGNGGIMPGKARP
jgi:hypothetical protein